MKKKKPKNKKSFHRSATSGNTVGSGSALPFPLPLPQKSSDGCLFFDPSLSSSTHARTFYFTFFGHRWSVKPPRLDFSSGSLFLSFVLLFFFCSVLLPPYAHQLPGLGWMTLPSASIRFFFDLSFLFLLLKLLRADPAAARKGMSNKYKINKYIHEYIYYSSKITHH